MMAHKEMMMGLLVLMTVLAPGREGTIARANSQDRAFTAVDQDLLIKVRREVHPVIGANEGWSPVQVVARNGTITLLGTVATPQERERVLSAAEQVQGVQRLVDGLSVQSENRDVSRKRAEQVAKAEITRSGGITPSARLTPSEGVTPGTGLSRADSVGATGSSADSGISGTISGSNSVGSVQTGILTNQSRVSSELLTNQPAVSPSTNSSSDLTNTYTPLRNDSQTNTATVPGHSDR